MIIIPQRLKLMHSTARLQTQEYRRDKGLRFPELGFGAQG